MDSAFHWINHYPADSTIGFVLTHLIVIYLVDTAIHLLNEQGQYNSSTKIQYNDVNSTGSEHFI